jgi:hypothetical protein
MAGKLLRQMDKAKGVVVHQGEKPLSHGKEFLPSRSFGVSEKQSHY